MFKKIFLLSMVGLLVLGIAVVALADQDTGSQTAAKPNRTPIFSQLNLTDEQYAKLRELNNEYFDKVLDLRNELAKKHLELRNLYLYNEPDESAIEQKRSEINTLMQKIREISEEFTTKAKSVLTQEQLDKLGEFKGKGFGRGFGFGFGFDCGFGFGMRGGRGMMNGFNWTQQQQQ
ncbi:Spy/CpxP family protein refolding chaperone [Thermoanaerobacterium sp. DL9XJH110]|uniref:Spy/CpxP family protein refolding chaperone n=1 Tax=Thermoanaerobacterium sp. DL9XJH110 TaxID=3386643 RepID=UPI003BB6258C